MILTLEILGAWCALNIILAPVLIPLLVGRFRKHDQWVKAERVRPPEFQYPIIREIYRAR